MTEAISALVVSQTVGLGRGESEKHSAGKVGRSVCSAFAQGRFYVELRPDETTVVSWKKLLKEAQRSHGLLPLSLARIPLMDGSNSGEDENNCSDVHSDRHDTSNSFTSDAELDKYFSVKNTKTKRTGFLTNKGKQERENDSESLPKLGLKKRKRKDGRNRTAIFNEKEVPKKLLKMGVRMKDAARKGSSTSGLVKTADQLTKMGKDSKHLQYTADFSREKYDIVIKSEAEPGFPIMGNELALPYNSKGSKQDLGGSRKWFETAGFGISEVSCYELSDSSDSSDTLASQMKGTNSQTEAESKDLMSLNPTKMQTAQIYVRAGVKNFAGSSNFASTHVKKTSPGLTKGTMLEMAIHDLEKGVVEFCPLSLDTCEHEQSLQSGGKRKRLSLPQDIKQRLSKVAQLAVKQGKISDDLINRLMEILGNMVHVKTLKRHLKKMVEAGLSSKQEEPDRLQSIKEEVAEMVRSSLFGQQGQSIKPSEELAYDQQTSPNIGEKGSSSRLYQWNQATEDRVCDLYEHYFQGMDHNRGPEIRKLYAQLAELWPEGLMDSSGLKHAIHRARERKKRQCKPANGVIKKETHSQHSSHEGSFQGTATQKHRNIFNVDVVGESFKMQSRKREEFNTACEGLSGIR